MAGNLGTSLSYTPVSLSSTPCDLCRSCFDQEWETAHSSTIREDTQMAKAKNECVVDVTNHLARALIAAHGAAAADFAELALADCLHVGLIEASEWERVVETIKAIQKAC
jgi:hypothetical protein